MSFPTSFFDPVTQPLVLSTAQHSKTFKWLGMDSAKVVAYGFYATYFDTVDIFCLNLLAKKFRKCLTIKFTDTTNNPIIFAPRNLLKFLYSAAISEDGKFIGIIQSAKHLQLVNLFIISLDTGNILDKFQLSLSEEISQECRYRCRLKNLQTHGWILHYENSEKRKYYRIELDKTTKIGIVKFFAEIDVNVLRQFDNFIRSEFTRILNANDHSIRLNYIPNTNEFPEYDFTGKLDAHPTVSHVCFFPFKRYSDSLLDNLGYFPKELEAEYGSCSVGKIRLLELLKKMKFSGAYFMYINANNLLHVTVGRRIVPQWRVGEILFDVPPLERLAACQFFSSLHDSNKRISETKTERLGLNQLLIRKYFGPYWLREKKIVEAPVL